MPEEERKVEPYYQTQGKFLVDALFDKGLLSESLSRDGMDRIEDLVAVMFQQHADAAARLAGFTKKYKDIGDGQRHEEEMRWIARAREAEHNVLKLHSEILELESKLEDIDERQRAEVEAMGRLNPATTAAWAFDVGRFLKDTLNTFPKMEVPRNLLERAFEEGILEPDCRPGKIWNPCEHSADPYPGCIIVKCMECGGSRVVTAVEEEPAKKEKRRNPCPK